MLNYKGLRKRQTYDNIIDYLENHQEIIKYPNRVATRRMNDNIFNEEYEQLKQKRYNIFNSDKETQTDFYKHVGMTVNLKNFREQWQN